MAKVSQDAPVAEVAREVSGSPQSGIDYVHKKHIVEGLTAGNVEVADNQRIRHLFGFTLASGHCHSQNGKQSNYHQTELIDLEHLPSSSD